MIDTVRLKHNFLSMPDDHIESTGAVRRRSGELKTWVLNPPKGRYGPRITFISLPKGAIQVRSEISIPRYLYGNNQDLPSEQEAHRAMTNMCGYVSEVTHLEFTLESAVVDRADFAVDWVSESDSEALVKIRELSRRSLSRMDKLFYNESTLYFKPLAKKKDREIRIYSKNREAQSNSSNTPSELAPGTIRFELSLNRADRIEKELKSNGFLSHLEPTMVVSQAVSNRLITELFKRLEFPFKTERSEQILMKLAAVYKPKKALELLGFVTAIRTLGTKLDELDRFKLSKHQYYRMCRELKAAGIALHSIQLE